MVAFKMNALAGMLALMGAFAPTALATGSGTLSACTTTETTVSEQQGSITSEGQVLYTWNVCSIIRQTECAVSMSTAGPVPEPAPTGASSVPGGYSAPGQGPSGPGGPGASQPGQPGQPGNPTETAPDPGKPGYTVPGVPGTQPGETQPAETHPGHPGETHPGQPGESVTGGVPPGQPTPTAISSTDEFGNPTVVTSTPTHGTESAHHSHSGSVSPPESVTGTATGTGTGAYPSGTAPSATATGSSATMLNGVLASLAGAIGIIAAYLL